MPLVSMRKTGGAAKASAATNPKPAAADIIDVESESIPAQPAEQDPAARADDVADAAEATPESRAVARTADSASTALGVGGDFDADDIRPPLMKIVNGSGPLSEDFNQGSLLIDGELLFDAPDLKNPDKNPTVRFLPLSIVKLMRENVSEEEYKEGVIPRIVSRAEAEELGGGTKWEDGEKPRWSPCAKCILMLEAPEGGTDHPAFTHEIGGKSYAFVVYWATGSAWRNFGQLIFNQARMSCLEDGKIVPYKRVWTFQVKKVKAGNFAVFVPAPRMLRNELTPAEVRDFVENVAFAPIDNDPDSEG